jgi:hypothetical protein
MLKRYMYDNINANARKKFYVRLFKRKKTQAAFKISLFNRFKPLQELS